MNTALHLVTCPQCLGSAISQSATGSISCLTCNGTGVWLEDDSVNRFQYPLPAFGKTALQSQIPYQKWLSGAIAVLSVGGLALTTLSILGGSEFTVSSLLWQRGLPNALFALSGFGTIYSLSYFQSKHTTKKSLLDLSPTSSETVDLSDYAHDRVSSFLQALPRVAYELHQSEVTPATYFIALLREDRIRVLITRLEHSASQIEEMAKTYLLSPVEQATSSLPFSAEIRPLFYAGIQESLSHQFPYIDLEDLFLAISKDPLFSTILKSFDIGENEIYAVSRWLAGEDEASSHLTVLMKKGRTRPKGFMNRAWTALPTPVLDSYSVDITRMAASGNARRVTVREAELSQMLQVLGRTQKNNVLLLGDPGVGKNSMLDTLSSRMVQEQVPEILKDKRLVKLDVGSLFSDPASSGQIMQTILDETAHAGNVILCIPDVQNLIGSGSGSMDAATLLSSALNKGWIQVVTTATYPDFHKYVESNTQLTSLLETIELKEATIEQTIQILEEEVSIIKYRQKVFLTYPALEAGATLAKKYMPERILPASAIDLIDETASFVRQSGRQLVTKDDIEEVLEKKTGIPVKKAGSNEAELLLNLEAKLHTRIIGQELAVKSVANSLRRARAGLHDSNRPISSFLFIGPTGVGKTETAKALAELYFGSEKSMIRFDMSEYQDNRSIYKLIGAPAASSESYTEGGSLTQPIREHPFSLILLDELEKADPGVLNVFLQIFDDGRATENTGRTVYFNNTIIIATSNAGTSEILQLMQQGLPVDELPGQILRILQNYFRPEFLNRFDGIIPFHPLTHTDIQQVVGLMLTELVAKMALQHYEISFSADAIEKIARIGFDPLYGARPIRRVIQERVEGKLAEMVLGGTLLVGNPLQINADMID